MSVLFVDSHVDALCYSCEDGDGNNQWQVSTVQLKLPLLRKCILKQYYQTSDLTRIQKDTNSQIVNDE